MAIVKTYDVFCDRCPMWASGAASTTEGATAARQNARACGYVRRAGEDLCPDCRKRDDDQKKARR